MAKPHCPLYSASLPRVPGPPDSRTMLLALLVGAGPLEVCPSLFPGPPLFFVPKPEECHRQTDVLKPTLLSGWVLTWTWPLLRDVPSAICVSVFSSVRDENVLGLL